MKKQINSLTACCIIAAAVLIWQFPVLVIPPVSVSVLTPTILAHQLEVEHAARKAQNILKNYSCDRDVVYAIARHAVARNVSSGIVAATVAVESSCRADAKSKAGAIGLMQVMADLHKVQNAAGPENNIAAGTLILSENIHKYGKREGIKRYFGSSPNSTKSDEYADKVIMLAAKGE